MRRRFNEGRYMDRLGEGEDDLHVDVAEVIGPSPKDCPGGGRSQMVEFKDRFDGVVVRAHQKAGRPNGLPVEGTLTDPKYIYEGGVRYKHHKRLDWMPPDHPGFPHPSGGRP
jgi:hypothetical protein